MPCTPTMPAAHINLRTANWSHWGPLLPVVLRGRNLDVLSNAANLKSEWRCRAGVTEPCWHM